VEVGKREPLGPPLGIRVDVDAVAQAGGHRHAAGRYYAAAASRTWLRPAALAA
jgi:hypothetical protein